MKLVKGNCLFCGKEFEGPDYINKKFCSSRCRCKFNKPKKVYEERECIVCKKKFIPKNIQQKNCSPKCKNEWDKVYKMEVRRKIRSGEKEGGKERTCVICGKVFIDNTNRKTCSRECEFEIRRINSKNKRPIRNSIRVTDNSVNDQFEKFNWNRNKDLIAADKEAKENGMTYGQYYAQKYAPKWSLERKLL